ncbi:hypothetical protein BCIN_02g07910 [Botrytis cinerea B05.10]|uniref:2EXR domain-containing protein n=1 Tax=Botryotinia fuckeliana (strain B05.10) TaxID=332648 RepID=A0A384JAC7_BOTFB|nr:hypothetical protein BCIN_02g07910 [Botrytis cinerea B05.10]ATZ47519.1 hypothetical protein BCIN_02g07910 [Botrytis cinerea B05.10]
MKVVGPQTEREIDAGKQCLKNLLDLQMADKLDMVSKWPSQWFDIILRKHHNHKDYKGVIELFHELDLWELRSFLLKGLTCRNLSEYRNIRYPHIESGPKTQLGDRTFPSFKKLPAELRLDIWEYAFAEDLLPKVHHLNNTDRNTGKITDSITSHLSFSNIVQVCKESREWYLSRTQNTWAFGTYINFHVDILYLTKQIEASKIVYETLLSCPHMAKVQNLALRRTFLTDNPQSASTQVEASEFIRENIPSLKNIYVVINEIRDSTIIDRDNDIKFQHLSARQKRKWVDIGYARTWLKWVNKIMIGKGYNSVNHHFVMVGTQCTDVLSSDYGEVTFERKIRDGSLELF